MNIRDFASINELAVLSNIESMNAEMIRRGIEKIERFKQLNEISNHQLGKVIKVKLNDFKKVIVGAITQVMSLKKSRKKRVILLNK